MKLYIAKHIHPFFGQRTVLCPASCVSHKMLQREMSNVSTLCLWMWCGRIFESIAFSFKPAECIEIQAIMYLESAPACSQQRSCYKKPFFPHFLPVRIRHLTQELEDEAVLACSHSSSCWFLGFPKGSVLSRLCFCQRFYHVYRIL